MDAAGGDSKRQLSLVVEDAGSKVSDRKVVIKVSGPNKNWRPVSNELM